MRPRWRLPSSAPARSGLCSVSKNCRLRRRPTGYPRRITPAWSSSRTSPDWKRTRYRPLGTKRFWVASSEGVSLAPRRAAAAARPSQGAIETIGGGLANWLPALPLLVLAATMLVAPTIALIVGSFGIPQTLTLEYWIDTFQSNGGGGGNL